MNAFDAVKFYTPRKLTVKEAINAKMKVLREFHVLDGKNDAEIRLQLKEAVDSQPGKDYELILDRVAHSMIEKKLNT